MQIGTSDVGLLDGGSTERGPNHSLRSFCGELIEEGEDEAGGSGDSYGQLKCSLGV